MEEHRDRYHKNKIHRVSAHSYLVYLALVLVGTVLDLTFRVRIFTEEATVFIGPLLVLGATLWILWTVRFSQNPDPENVSKESFARGPYGYTRSPTQWGLFFLMLGFGIILNATFVILFTLVAFLLIRIVFLKRREDLLEERYGVHYTEYKKSVHF